MSVGVVIVSHSAQLAEGVKEVAAQMAPDIAIVAAGGQDDDTTGTSLAKVNHAVSIADTGQGVIVLCDLGSARMTAELTIETLEAEQQKRVVLVDAPLVEGAIAAAVAAQGNSGVEEVARAAREALQAPHTTAANFDNSRPVVLDSPVSAVNEADVVDTFTLRNELGLHARPAAQLARMASHHNVHAEIGRNNGDSVDIQAVLRVVGLGMRGGELIQMKVWGHEAQEFVRDVRNVVDDGFGERDDVKTAVHVGHPTRTDEIAGVGVVSGLIVGPVLRLRAADPVVPRERADDPQREMRRLLSALDETDMHLAAETKTIGPIADAHRAFLADPTLRDEASRGIAEGWSAVSAWWDAVTAARQTLTASQSDIAAERAVDVMDVGLRVLGQLQPGIISGVEIPEDVQGAIVVADDLVPSLVPRLVRAGVAGFALARSAPTSHVVIVARGLGVPMVVNIGNDVLSIHNGTLVLLDGDQGLVQPNPSRQQMKGVKERNNEKRRTASAIREQAQGPVVLPDGRHILVMANVGSAEEASAGANAGADGVGLVRTELLLEGAQRIPSEEEQQAVLHGIFREFPRTPVTVRTLDAGGDKNMPALKLDSVRNGFLGQRGLRYSLAHPELLRTQLRAIMRAAADREGPYAVMAPMVSVAEEVVAFRDAVTQAAHSLDADAVPYRLPTEIGVMVEVPTAAIAADHICDIVDFVSVGSNDLVQYLFAAERTNDLVSDLYRPDHPAVWTVLELLTSTARNAGCRVAVCGEMAADPEIAARLVSLGIDELSMAPSAIPVVKAHLRERAFTI